MIQGSHNDTAHQNLEWKKRKKNKLKNDINLKSNLKEIQKNYHQLYVNGKKPRDTHL